MRSARWWVPAVVVAMAVAGCSRSGGKASGSGSTTTTARTAGAAGAGTFGDAGQVCGPGDAKGATEQGVTDTTIRVGTMADPGAQVQPGLDQELFDTATAFVGWCNAAGGINGRTLQLDKWDSKLTEVAARMIQACASDFMLVGNGEAFDSAGVDQRVKCRLGEIPAYDVSKQAAAAPMTVQPIAASAHTSAIGGALRILKETDPEAARHLGQLSSQLQSVKDAGDRDRSAAKQLGYVSAYYDEAPILIDNFRTYAQNLQSKGVQVFLFENAPDNLAALYRALAELKYFPKWGIYGGNMYDPKLVKNAGGALQGNVLIVTNAVPFELASTHPATKQYIDILAKYAGGAQPKSLGINAWSAWLLWAKSAKACGSHLTRTCVLDKAAAVTSWTAGGLHAPAHPGNANQSASPCFVFVRATPSGFKIDEKMTHPTRDIFNCDPRNVVKLPDV
ncbi:MAG TPA: ABC transporter substrate-binding protein [Acidimicrobiia bacterium]|nr:ABC transporter substrate-binding protein [Acidimicrobiia bacterium]